MTYQEKPADNSTNVYFGIEWNESNAGATFSITPKIYRWDRQSTDNSGGRWSEDITKTSGSGADSWSGLSFVAGSGYRTIDTFSKRTYTKTRSTQTIYYHLYTDANFGTYYNGWSTLGAQTWTFTMTIPAKASYAVTFNANGGSGAPSSQTKWYDESLTLSTTKPTRTNYVFKNWNTKSDGTGTAYSSGASYTGNSALALYAQWYAPYTVSFNANGGSGAPSNQTKVYNTTLKLSTTAPTRTGYTFKGWNTKSDGSGTNYASGANYTANAAVTLYAVWQINTWTVSYNGNGSTGGSTAAQTKTYNQSLTLRSNGFTKTGYNFVNWNTAANGSGRGYAAGVSYTGNAALTLYAQWVVAHSNPTIQSITVKRCDADGTDNVEGTRMHVVATWKVDNTTDGFTDTVGSTFKVTLGGTTDTVNLSGTSGTVDFVHSATAAIGSSYTVTSVLADSKGYSTTRTSTLSVAYFTMHFKAGGRGVGIGKPATVDNLLDVGMDVRSSGKVEAGTYLQVDANSSGYGAVRFAGPQRAGDAIKFYGSTENADGDEIVVCNGGQIIVGAGESGNSLHTALNQAVGTEQLYLASDNSVYIFARCNTIANRAQYLFAGQTNPAIYLNQPADSAVNIGTSANNGVTENTSIGHYVMRDKNGTVAGHLGARTGASGEIVTYVGARNKKTDGTVVDNYMSAIVNKDGTQTYSVSSPANFRSAIGSNSAANLTTGTLPAERLTHVGWTYLTGSATASFYVRWCKVANIVHVEVYGAKSMSAGADVTFSSTAITSGNRPSKEVDAFLYSSQNAAGVLWVMTDGKVHGKIQGYSGTYVYGFLSYPVI